MREQERRMLRCIGGIDDELILEAASLRFKPGRWIHLAALAACVALVIAVPVFLNSGRVSPEAGSPYEQAETPKNSNKLTGTEEFASEGGSYDLRFGVLELGMAEEEVIAALGEPLSRDYSCLNYSGISIEISRFLPQVITIDLLSGSLTLPSGIGPGSTEKELLNTYPELERNDIHEGLLIYSLHQSDQRMTVTVQNGEVVRITLEQLGDMMLKALTVPEITIYQWMDKAWQPTTVVDKAAKYICTILTISEPEEASGEKTGVSVWMDFGNGTAVELLGDDRAAVWAYDGVFEPDRTDGMTSHLSGRFDGLDEYVQQALDDPAAGWD